MIVSRRSPRYDSRTGSTLALSLIVVVTMVILSGAFLQISSAVTKRQARAADLKRSFYLAEAGLAESFAGLRIGKTGEIGSGIDPAIFGDGLFWVISTPLGDGMIHLESTGMCGTASTSLELVVEDGSSSVAALGVFTGGDLEVPSGSLFDAYDSDVGPYNGPTLTGTTSTTSTTTSTGTSGGTLLGGISGGGGTVSSSETLTATYEAEYKGVYTLYEDTGNRGIARVSTNGDVTVYQDDGDQTIVAGDLRPGEEGTVTAEGEPTIEGSVSPLITNVLLPNVQVPSYSQLPGLIQTSSTPLVLPSTEGSFVNLVLSSNTQVTVTGPSTLVLEQLVVMPGAELVFDTTGGPIQVFVEETLNLAPGSYVTFPAEDPTAFSLAYTGIMPATLSSDAAFFGAIYGPLATLSVASSFEVFGALVGAGLEFTGPANVHFDLALGASAVNAALPALLSWRILALESGTSPSGNPFTEQGVTPTTLRPPSLAHEDQVLELQYYDRTGTLREYQGMESNFDWFTVSQVLTLERDGNVVGEVIGLAGIGGEGEGSGIIGIATK